MVTANLRLELEDEHRRSAEGERARYSTRLRGQARAGSPSLWRASAYPHPTPPL